MVELVTAAVIIAATPKTYVDGYGWATSRSVGACLSYVGEHNVNVLTDGKWEQFTDCLADENLVR
jgi:hypothetical protein